MNRIIPPASFGLSFCLLIVGCSDPTSPTTSNYEIAIQKHFEEDDRFPHCFFRYNFPYVQNQFQLKMSGNSDEVKFLTQQGLVSEQVEEQKTRRGLTKVYQYQLTDYGKEFYIQDRGLCMGKPKLTGIKDVSEPYEERGKTYVRGTYTWTLELPDWALEPTFHESDLFGSDLYYFKLEKLAKGEDREDYFVLTQNDDGWGY